SHDGHRPEGRTSRVRARRFRLHAPPPHKIRGVALDTLPWDARYASCTRFIYASPPCGLDTWNIDICNIRTTTRFRIRRLPKHMEAQGFVSKNDRLGKVDRQTISQEHTRDPESD